MDANSVLHACASAGLVLPARLSPANSALPHEAMQPGARWGRIWRDAVLAHPGAHLADYAADAPVVGEGEVAEAYFRVVAGVFRAVKYTPDGRRQVFAFHQPGDLFGFEAGGWRATTIEAVSDGLLAVYSRSAAERALGRDATLANALFAGAAAALERATEHMMMLGRSSAEERVAWFLWKVVRGREGAARRRNESSVAPSRHLAMSRRDMADFLGLTIETISRTIGVFRRQGLIRLLSAREVEILRPQQLARLAAADRDHPAGGRA